MIKRIQICLNPTNPRFNHSVRRALVDQLGHSSDFWLAHVTQISSMTNDIASFQHIRIDQDKVTDTAHRQAERNEAAA